MSESIVLIGLEQMGASIGLALAKAGVEAKRLGFDPDPAVAKSALQAGAVDQLVSRPARVADQADLVLISLINDEAQEYLESILPRLKAEAVIIDAAPNKRRAVQWSAEAIPEEVHYVSITPVVGAKSLESQHGAGAEARAERFHGGIMAIIAGPKTHEKAVEAAASLAEVLGASTFFVGPNEHDAIMSAVEDLPILMSMALIRTALKAPSWREIQRMAGSPFYLNTTLCEPEAPRVLGRIMNMNREHILPRLDAFLAEIGELRTLIEQSDAEDVEALLQETAEARRKWVNVRHKGDWRDPTVLVHEMPKRSIFGRLFGVRGRKDREK